MDSAPQQLTELPNSDAQRERIRKITQCGPAGRLRHCLTVAVEIRGQVDEAELRSRLDRIVTRRPALGSVFTGNLTHQLRGGTPAFRQQVISASDAESRWRIAMEIAQFEAQRPFRAGEHPLIRGLLLSAETDRHLFVLNFDQLVSDNWSANLVLDDLFDLDGAGTRADPDAYPRLWRERADWLAGPAGSAAISRRRAHLADAALNWPVPVDPDAEGQATVADRFLAIDETVTERLRCQVRQARGSLLAAAAMALVVSLVEDRDQPLGLLSTLAGRESPAEQAVVGWFANCAVIRLPPRGGTIQDFATALRGEIFAALGAQRVPFELVAESMPAGEPGGPSCALVFLPKGFSGGRQPEQRMGGALITRAAVDVCPAGADIDFFLIEDAAPMQSTPSATLTIGASTWTDVAGPETVHRMLERWVSVLAALAEYPWASTPLDRVASLAARGQLSLPGPLMPP